jgi:hypothetical protein
MVILTEINLYPGLKQSGHDVDCATPFSASIVRDESVCTSASSVRVHGMHSDKFPCALAAEIFCISDSARRNLTEAIRVTGDTYCEIGKLFEEQPKADWEPLGDVLHLYKGIISSYPDILTVHKVSEVCSYLMF